MFRELHRNKRLLMAADAFLPVFVLAAMVEASPFLSAAGSDSVRLKHELPTYIAAGLLWHVLFATTGVYEIRRIPDFFKQVGRFTSSYLLAILTLTGFLYFTTSGISRAMVGYFFAATYGALLFVRWAVFARLKRKLDIGERSSVLILGASETGAYLVRTMNDRDSMFKPVGFVDDQPPSIKLPAPFRGTRADVPRLVADLNIETIIVSLPGQRMGELEEILPELERLPVMLYVVPDMLEVALYQSEVERVGELVLIGVRQPVIRGHAWVMKRLLDLTVSALVVAATWPLWIVIYLAIKIDSPGPALFVADRVGMDRKPFKMFKFRTMRVGLEHMLIKKAADPEKSREEVCETVYKTEDDPRITRVGKWLRKTSLDELPQLINVFRGEMSLVGPRPEQPFLTQCYDHWQWQRVAVPPGVTGWWQISGRSDLPMHLNAQYDMFYVRNYSLLLDLRILLKTVWVVLKGKGAY